MSLTLRCQREPFAVTAKDLRNRLFSNIVVFDTNANAVAHYRHSRGKSPVYFCIQEERGSALRMVEPDGAIRVAMGRNREQDECFAVSAPSVSGLFRAAQKLVPRNASVADVDAEMQISRRKLAEM